MVLEATAETYLAHRWQETCERWSFQTLRSYELCENSTAFVFSLIRAMTRTALRALLLVSDVFTCRQVSMTFLKTVQSLVHTQDQASSKRAFLRRLSLQPSLQP